jgi:WD40 repeat protein
MWAAVIDTADGKELYRLEDRSPPVAFLADGDRYITAVCEPMKGVSTLTLRDVPTGKVVRTFSERPDQIRCLAVSPDDKLALSGHSDGNILSWDLATGKRSRDFDVSDRKISTAHMVYSIFFSPDGKRAYSNDQRTLTVWDTATGKQTLPSFERYQKVNGQSHIAFGASADGRLVSTGCHLFDREQPLVQVWDTARGRMVGSFRGHHNDCYILGAALTPEGTRCFSAGRSPDNTLREWDVSTGKQVWKWDLGDDCRGIAFSGDAGVALVGNVDGTLRLLDLRKKKVLWKQKPRKER